MTSCSLYASGLVPDVSGAVPTFSYRQDNRNGDYFGIQMTYLRGTSTCYQTGSLPQFTPVIQNEAAKFSEECVFRTQGTTYTGIFCPDTPVTQIPNGVLTVSYVNWYRGQPTPIPFLATFGPSPAPKTVTASANALATSTSTVTATASAGFAATATAYSASDTQTKTSTIIVTQTQTTTNTNYVSSCSTSSTSSKSSSSSTPSASPSSSTKPSSSSTPSSSSLAGASSSNPTSPSSSSATPSSSSSALPSSSSLVKPSSSSSATPSSSSSATTSSSSSAKPSSSSSATPSSSSSATPSLSSSATPSPSSKDAVSSSSATAPSATATPTSLSCPDDNGKSIDTAAGTFVVECYIDRSGGDLSTQYPTGGFNGCIQLCANTKSCIDVSYSPNGPCYLKGAQGIPTPNKGIWAARLASATPSSVSGKASTTSTGATTTSTGPVATSSVICPGSNGQTINTSAGTFLVECGTDRIGGDMSKSPVYPASYEGCIAACAARDGCLDVSYIPSGPCYLKNMAGTPVQNGNIIGGRLIGSRPSATVSTSASSGASGTASPAQTVTVTTTISDTAYQCTCTPASGLGKGAGSLSCPLSDGKTYTSDCGATYAIECSSDRYGDDIPGGSSSASTLDECIADCDETNGCVDVSWVAGSPGTCYKKSSIAEIRLNDNIWGARQLTGCKASTKLKLHRKRVVRQPAGLKKRAPGGYYGPDFTYTQGSTTSTKTSTATTVSYATVTVTPPNSGTTTKTVYTTATRTATVTNAATTTETQQTTVTTCPAVTKRAIL